MKYFILLILLTGCTIKEEHKPVKVTQSEIEKINLSPEELKQWTLDSLCKARKHVWNGITTGEIERDYHQTLIDYKDSSVLFNEEITVQWFDCVRCKKKIFTNDTTITERIRILPQVEFVRDTTQLIQMLPTNHVFTPDPPIKR